MPTQANIYGLITYEWIQDTGRCPDAAEAADIALTIGILEKYHLINYWTTTAAPPADVLMTEDVQAAIRRLRRADNPEKAARAVTKRTPNKRTVTSLVPAARASSVETLHPPIKEAP